MICVVQFDSASVRVLDRLLAAGRLPALSAAIERGSRLDLETPAVDFPAGAFPTLYSGVPVADHGTIYPFQWSPEDMRVRFGGPHRLPPTVWERMTGTGMRALVVDPYEAHAPDPSLGIEGLVVSAHGLRERTVLPRWVRPRRAALRLRRRYGRSPDVTEVFGERRARDLLRWREAEIAAPARTVELICSELESGAFDLIWATFNSPHFGGHAFWEGGTADRSGLGSGQQAQLDTALEEIYEAVDRAIGRLIELLPADCELIITSPLGMDVNTSRADLVSEMLDAVLSGRAADAVSDVSAESERTDSEGSIWAIRDRIPASLRQRIANLIPPRLALELTARLELREMEPARTCAFSHPSDNQGYVRLNLRGREREGIVEPGPEADALLDEISEGLLSFELEDGSPALERVVRTSEHYEGRRLEDLPDLVLHWSRRPSIGPEALRSERFGVVRRHGAGSGRAGNHTAGDAWAVLVPARAELREPSRPPRIEDVAVTILDHLGLEPGEAVGEPLLRARSAAESGRLARAGGGGAAG